MNIFGGLFNRFMGNNGRNSGHRINYDNKTPIKVQIMNKALCCIEVECAGYLYRLNVPKRLYNAYKKSLKKDKANKKLTAMDKTRLYGYLNPKYHVAEYPRKRVH